MLRPQVCNHLGPAATLARHLSGNQSVAPQLMADSSPVKDFLTTIGLGQHRDAVKTAGYDDVEDYTQMGANELEAT